MLEVIVMLIGAMVLALFQEQEKPDPLLVHTAQGVVMGVKEYSEKGNPIFSYYAIPYAKPPLGKLRLQDPVEADPWEGVWNGTSQPEPCLQISLPKLIDLEKITDEDVFGTEDCLYLNVFTPMPSVEGGLVVLVYIHGGAFVWGSAKNYPPYVLLNHRVVLVVLQYRLGALGFLSTEDSILPGNLGLKDQSLALRWVQRNIHVFGGDPNRVTVFGESVGAASTHLQILSPKSAGLFSRAILQSGTAISFGVREGHRKIALDWAQMLGCPATNDSMQILSCLQRVDARKLTFVPTQTYVWFILPTTLAPRVDGDFIPSDPTTLMSEARYSKVDLITSSTAHDGAFFTLFMYMKENMLAQLRDNFTVIGPLSLILSEDKETSLTIASQIFDHYMGVADLDVAHSDDVTQLYTDFYFNVPSDLTAQLHARNTGPARNTYITQLTHRGQRSVSDLFEFQVGRHWVNHADDLIYLFSGGPLYQHLPLERPDDLKLRDIMTSLWVNFATTGNPTPDDSLGFKWEAATKDNLHYLCLTPTPSMHQDSRPQVRRFFRSLPTKQNLILNQQLAEEEEDI